MARVISLCQLTFLSLVVVCCVSSLRIRPRPCRLVRCYRPCPHGYKTVRGCQTCTCKDPPTKPVCGPICKKFCPNGFVEDKRGCPTCTCKPCPHIKCSRTCSHGYKFVRGCQTCTCKDPPKPVCGPICRMHCPNGFVKDHRGCPICRCNRFPRPCRPLQCALACRAGGPKPECNCPPCSRRPTYLP